MRICIHGGQCEFLPRWGKFYGVFLREDITRITSRKREMAGPLPLRDAWESRASIT